MSWKGITKAITRLPHQVLSKTGYSEETKDHEFIALEKHFTELEKITDKLHEDALKYRDTLSAMLNHQATFADVLVEIYSSSMGQQVTEVEGGTVVVRRTPQTPHDAVQAVSDFASFMAETRDMLFPELDMVDRRVVQPTADLKEILKLIRKTITKRGHQMVDYDRYRVSLKKLKDKKERSLNEEKQIFKLEAQLDTATREFEYYNDICKTELPTFFRLRVEFIDPIFQSFFFMQCRIYGMILRRMQDLSRSSYFTSMDRGVIEGFSWRRDKDPVNEKMEEMELLRRTTIVGSRKGSAPDHDRDRDRDRSHDSDSSPRPSATFKRPIAPNVATSSAYIPASRSYQENDDVADHTESAPPPAYTPVPGTGAVSAARAAFQNPKTATGSSSSYSASGANKAYPSVASSSRPPPPAPRGPKPTFVVALYDYEAQADGDLSFHKDDKIEVIEKTQDVNDWWTGKFKGKVGVFPGNYVTDM